MAKYSEAEWRPLPENDTQHALIPTQFIFHTAVDHPGPTNLPGYFARADITVESHFWLPLDGKLVQMMDTEVVAHANLKGNSRAISIETEDEGNPEGVPWTFAQLDTMVKLLLWVNAEHGVPLELMGEWTAPGVGYHAMWGFVDPIAQVGRIRSPWTNSSGKTCPGKTRIRQLLEIILPEAQEQQAESLLQIDMEVTHMALPLNEWHKLVADAGVGYSAAVELWQRMLKAQGFNPGPVDGFTGASTRIAHKAWTASVPNATALSLPSRWQWVKLLNLSTVKRIDTNQLEQDLSVAEAKIDDALEALR